jgi:hypothetical protein
MGTLLKLEIARPAIMHRPIREILDEGLRRLEGFRAALGVYEQIGEKDGGFK